jgi:hypothetical protein
MPRGPENVPFFFTKADEVSLRVQGNALGWLPPFTVPPGSVTSVHPPLPLCRESPITLHSGIHQGFPDADFGKPSDGSDTRAALKSRLSLPLRSPRVGAVLPSPSILFP